MTSSTRLPDVARDARFVRLLTQHERRLYGFILGQVPNWADADEILQETNVRLWQQFDRFAEGTDFLAWACTIAAFQVKTFRRRQTRQKVQFSTAFLDAVAAESQRTMPAADVRESALVACLDRLQESARTLIEHCYRRQESVKDAAAALGRGVEATYKALARVRQVLHDCIERRLAGDG